MVSNMKMKTGSERKWKQGLAWTKKLETGHNDIDNQHKRIFWLVNDLIESCQEDLNRVTVRETLIFLVDYTVYHFNAEEKLLKKHKYPQYEEHKKMHGDFTETVIGFIKEYEDNGDSEALFAAVKTIILKWLIQHIQTEDQKIARHIKKEI